jgi:hypothetical protein
LVADALVTTSKCGVRGPVVVRADSAFYRRDVIAAADRARAKFSITARKDRAVTAAITKIPDDAWTPIRYPQAVFDEQLGQWVSDAEVAEIGLTAFTSHRRRTEHVTARLIVRRSGTRTPTTSCQRAGRIVPGLAAPRRVHQFIPADAGRRSRSPPARDHRTGHRRPEERTARAPALRQVHRQRGLAGAGHDGVQPEPPRLQWRAGCPDSGCCWVLCC